jgi:hypothetical protein
MARSRKVFEVTAVPEQGRESRSVEFASLQAGMVKQKPTPAGLSLPLRQKSSYFGDKTIFWEVSRSLS